MLFWSPNVVRGTFFEWQGTPNAVLESKRSTRNVLRVAGPFECCFGVQTQCAERSSNGQASKMLFPSTNAVPGSRASKMRLPNTNVVCRALLEWRPAKQNCFPVEMQRLECDPKGYVSRRPSMQLYFLCFVFLA